MLTNPDPRLTTHLFWVVYLPYNTSTTMSYAATMFFQIYASAVGIIVYACFDNLCFFLILHICGQCRIIQLSLKNLEDFTEPKNYWSNVGKIVRKHQEINQ